MQNFLQKIEICFLPGLKHTCHQNESFFSFPSFLHHFLKDELPSQCLGDRAILLCQLQMPATGYPKTRLKPNLQQCHLQEEFFTAHRKHILFPTPVQCCQTQKAHAKAASWYTGQFWAGEIHILFPSRWNITMRALTQHLWSMRTIAHSWICSSRNPWDCLHFWMRKAGFPKQLTRPWLVGNFWEGIYAQKRPWLM